MGDSSLSLFLTAIISALGLRINVVTRKATEIASLTEVPSLLGSITVSRLDTLAYNNANNQSDWYPKQFF